MPTIAECKSLIFCACIETGANPKEVSTRLLSAEDKEDMLNGDVPYITLVTAIRCWMNVGKPDYAHGKS